MSITIHDFPTFIDTIESLVQRGLTFEAHYEQGANRWTITLTGGY